jgi:tetratricopeptide (TPR) repeat protein
VLSYLHSSDVENSENKIEGDSGLNTDLLSYVVAPLLVITLGASLWYVNYRPISANLNLIKAMQPQQAGLSANLDLFKNALSNGPLGVPEIREQLWSVTPNILSISSVDQNTKQSFVDLSFSEIQNQLKDTPNDARYELFAGQFLENVGQYGLALPYLQKAVELSPNKLTMLFELTKDLAYMGEKTQALDTAKKAYDLMPEYATGKMNYIFAMIINGDEKDAKNLLGSATTTDQTVVRAYLINASAYLQKGDKTDAVAEVNKAIKIAPGFEAQGKQVIDGIWKGTVKE